MLRFPSLLFLALLATPALAADPLRVVVAADSSPESAKIRDGLVDTLRRGGAETHPADLQDGLILSDADVLVIYEKDLVALPEAARRAISQFAAAGHGLVALHGGIAAGDAAWLKPLLGGAWTPSSQRFQSRMMLYVATDQHPIVKGASAFDVDDETLYDLDLEKDVHVLASAFTPKITGRRAEEHGAKEGAGGSKANVFDIQPQLWAYEAPALAGGKAHRAVVALPGAAATLDHPSLHTFLLRSVAWTAGRENLDSLSIPADLAALRYPPGGPERPEDTVRQFQIEPGFKATVVAAEPLINKPIAIQWDARGRLWVAETPEYPNGRRPMVAEAWRETDSLVPGVTDRPAQDRISVLSEPDASGRFTKKTVFYEGLELVTGFCLYRDGVIALHEPDILWIRDTDGDGKADKVERLFTGFKPGDTHFVANHLINAPDGWIYASMGGDAEVRKSEGGEVLTRITSGLFRFKADGSAIEQVSSKGGNGFGAEYTSDGELFFGQATSGNPIQHVVLPERTLALGKLGHIGGAESVINQRLVARDRLPDRTPLMQIDMVGRYSAACSSLVYEGGAWPSVWNRSIFCTEPILNVIHREALEPAGPTFAGNMVRKDAEFIYSPDYWFRPVDVSAGPDGALYILDFYNPVIAHSDTRGPLHSRSGASVRPDREHYFGRIYRVQSDSAARLEVPDLGKASIAECVHALDHPNKTVRFNALQSLVEKGGKEISEALQPTAAGDRFAPGRILALWGLQRLSALPVELIAAALTDSDPAIRKTAALIVEARADAAQFQAALAAGLKDSDPRVRIAMLRGLASAKMNDASAAALVEQFSRLEDAWSKSAAIAAASRSPLEVISAAFANSSGLAARDLVSNTAARLLEKRDAATLGRLVEIASTQPAATAPLTRVVIEAAAKLRPAPPVSSEALNALLSSPHADLRATALPIAAGGAGQKVGVERVTRELLQALEAPEASEERRLSAARNLIAAHAASPEIFPAVQRLLSGTSAPEALKRDVIVALGETGDAAVGPLLANVFGSLSAAAQSKAFDVALTRVEWTKALLDGIADQRVRISDLGPANIFRLRSHPSKEIAKQAEEALNKLHKPEASKDAIIAQLTPIVTQPGNAAHGKEVFSQTCAICHNFGGIGKEIGPVLDGIGAHGPEALLVDIVDPSRQIDAGFELFNVETRDGQIQSGILAQENEARIVLRSPAGDVEVPMAQIKSRTNTHRSLMPEGFEGLGGETLRDILAFLCGDSARFRVLDLSHAFTADSRRGLYQSQDALGDTLPFRKFGLATVDGIPFEIANPESTPLGGNVIVLRGGPPDSFAHTLPKRVELPVKLAIAKLDFLGGVAGWGASAPNPEGRPIMKVTVHFADGQEEVATLRNGLEFADYAGETNVPGSKIAHGVLRDHQVRWFSIPVRHAGIVEKLTLESLDNGPAPTTVAITAELATAQ